MKIKMRIIGLADNNKKQHKTSNAFRKKRPSIGWRKKQGRNESRETESKEVEKRRKTAY